MATPPDNPPDEKPPNPVSQVTQQPTGDDHPNTRVSEKSPTSVFVNSEPIREEQVQNAVKFLSHPKVKGSPIMYRRSFLEKKGLTKEEIDEAFRRVPDPTAAVSATQPPLNNQDGQMKSSPIVQSQPPAQVLQPVGHVGPISKMGMLSRLHWYHTLLAVGFLAASGAGTAVIFKNTIIPKLKTWIRKVVSEGEEGVERKDGKPSVAEEAAAAAKAAAAAAASAAQATQDMSMVKAEEKLVFKELVMTLNSQMHEMKSMSNSIQKLESGLSVKGRVTLEEPDDEMALGINHGEFYANGKADTYQAVKSISPPETTEPSAAPHPKSYLEIMEMIQRGEKPSNIREINDAPPNPSQPVSNPRVAPRPKPWANQNNSNNTFPTIQESNDSNGDDALPFWLRKNPRITEIENGGAEEEQKFGYSNVVRSSWVPPQPPPVVMAEAAAAIRQPKKQSFQNEQMTDDQLLARSTEINDELQRITKLSESGGSNGESFSEIQHKEDNDSYLLHET